MAGTLKASRSKFLIRCLYSTSRWLARMAMRTMVGFGHLRAPQKDLWTGTGTGPRRSTLRWGSVWRRGRPWRRPCTPRCLRRRCGRRFSGWGRRGPPLLDRAAALSLTTPFLTVSDPATPLSRNIEAFLNALPHPCFLVLIALVSFEL